MAKRLSIFQNISSASKKPKLDITYGRKDEGGGCSKPQRMARSNSPVSINTENLFDDEDDDVMLLASENVEATQYREQFSQQILCNESNTEISFGQFAREIQTSTQIDSIPRDKVQPPKSVVDDAFDNIEKYFEDEIEINDVEGESNFKKPAPVKNIPQTSKMVTNDFVDKRQSTKERDSLVSQVKYLTEKIAAYKEQTEKLSKDAAEFNDKIQTKEGEVSMVRYQLRQVEDQNVGLRLEKMKEIDNMKKGWQEKIGELEKLIKSQQDELEFKNVEILNLKSSKLNESQRSFDIAEVKRDFKNIPFLYTLHLDLRNVKRPFNCKIPVELFEKKSEKNEKLKFRDAVFQRELQKVQSCLSQMTLLKRVHSEKDCSDDQIVASLKNTIGTLHNYAKKMEFMKYIDTNASIEYKFLCEENPDEPNCPIHSKHKSIFQEGKLYSTEKAEVARRLLGGFAIACKYSTVLCQSLVTEKIGDRSLIETLIDFINKVGFSKELFSHFGLLESLQYLLQSFIENSKENELNKVLISQYLRGIILCRPGYRPLVQISNSLLYVSTKFNDLYVLNSLCVNSPLGSFVFNEFYKIFQFTPDSCTLQVYGALLETAFPQNVNLPSTQIDCLLQICRNHIIFLRNCFERNVSWILKPESSSKNCDCYAKAVNSTVILIHLVLKQFIANPKSIDNRVVAEISRSGILLLCDTFYKNYRRDVLQNGASSVKHRLCMIHNWLHEYKAVFHFKSPHNYALQSIKLSHIIVNPIHMDESSVGECVETGDRIWNEIFENFLL